MCGCQMVIGNRSWDLTILWSGGITARSLDKTVSSQWYRPIERMGYRVNRIEHIHGGYIVQHIHTEKEKPLRGVHMDTDRRTGQKYILGGEIHTGELNMVEEILTEEVTHGRELHRKEDIYGAQCPRAGSRSHLSWRRDNLTRG